MSFIDEDDEYRQPREREWTLSTGTILAIFFGLVLLCGVFFGFGYNMGSRTRQVAQNSDVATSTPSTNFGGFSKPSAGSFSSGSNTRSSASNTATPRQTSPAPVSPQPEAVPAPIVRQPNPDEASGRTLPRPQPVTITPSTPPPPAAHAAATAITPPSPATVGTGSFMVQVAAVSHPDDAQLLVSALKARGYTVAAHTSSADSFYHVQVGPFGNKKDAEAMRQKLLADGYNAVLK